jgi:hypothetical protein
VDANCRCTGSESRLAQNRTIESCAKI